MKNLTKIYSKTLIALLALLGFSCVIVEDPMYGMPVMYGEPSAAFKAIGTVKDPDGKPVQGIRAVLKAPQSYHATDTAYTDLQGNFSLQVTAVNPRDSIHIELRDVDGTTNGLYADFDLPLDYSKENFVDGGEWFEGTATKDLGTITLDPVYAPEYGVAKVKNLKFKI
jgi:putative lipoprotein (rSAM/lipoprotein system)